MEAKRVYVIQENGDITYGIIFRDENQVTMVQTPFARYPVEERHMKTIRERGMMKL